MILPTISQPQQDALVESGGLREHMYDMRKFQHQVAVWGQRGTGTNFTSYISTPSLRLAADGKPFRTSGHSGRAFLDGMLSITLFPDATEVLSRIEPNGLRADWVKVGSDMRRAMDTWSSENGEGEPTSEREIA